LLALFGTPQWKDTTRSSSHPPANQSADDVPPDSHTSYVVSELLRSQRQLLDNNNELVANVGKLVENITELSKVQCKYLDPHRLCDPTPAHISETTQTID